MFADIFEYFKLYNSFGLYCISGLKLDSLGHTAISKESERNLRKVNHVPRKRWIAKRNLGEDYSESCGGKRRKNGRYF